MKKGEIIFKYDTLNIEASLTYECAFMSLKWEYFSKLGEFCGLFVVDYQVGFFGTHVGQAILSDPYAAVLNLKTASRKWIHLCEVCRYYDHTDISHTVVLYSYLITY